jgi:hypothetical protein
MEDTARTPLLPPSGTGPHISSSSEASSHDAGCSKFLPQEGQERDANQAAPRDQKKTEDTRGSQGSTSGTRETPPGSDRTDLGDHSGQIPAAADKTQGAVTNRKFFPSPRFPFFLRKTPAEMAAAGGETPPGSDRTDLGDHSGQIPAAADNTQGAVTNSKFFPFPRFPFFLRKTPAEMAAAGGETPLHRDCAALIKRLQDLERLSGSSSVIADPTARLIEATRSLALTDGADSKEIRKSQFEMILASMSLTMVASREKIAEEIATTAKNLASEAGALLPKTGGLEQQTGRSNDFLLCLTITGSLALLPYLPTQIPESLRPYIGAGFALVFYAASVGAILSFRATGRSHLKVADFLSTASFAGFSLLVIAFICSALSSGNVLLLIICALLLLAGQVYAWRW